MRTAIWLVALLVLLCGGAWADLCPKCVGMMYTMDVGVCKVCGGGTSSGAHQLCRACSKKLGQCEHCRAALNAAAMPEAKATVSVVLTKAGDRKIAVIKVVRSITSLGLKDAKDLVDRAPSTIMENVSRDVAEKIKQDLEAAGATVELKEADAAAKLAAERKKALVDDVENFALTLRYHGDEDKPFYWLTLCRRVRPTTAVYQFQLTGVIDKDTTLKVIDWLADSGVLAAAEDMTVQDGERKPPAGHCYVATITGGKATLRCNLGWGPDLAKKLTALRAFLKDDAAKQADTFLGRLSGYWKEWTGAPYEPPKASSAVEGPKDIAAAGAKLEQTPDGNFVLYVSNQSSALNPVDVKVTIDGRAAVDGSFDQAGGHNWKKFVFALAKGPHALKAESAKGGAVLTQKFEIKDKHWAVIDYWHDPRAAGAKKQFTFRIQDTPIYFM